MSENSPMRFLKKLREARGLKAYSMAKLLGLLTNTYLNYEEKAKGMNFKTLVHIKRKLDLTWTELGNMIEEEVALDDDAPRESPKKAKKQAKT